MAASDAGYTADREIVTTRIFDAPRELVFKAWTEPERLVRWWGPRGFTTPFCEMDVRPGGGFRFGMRSPEGTEHWLQGVYREILEPERLVFTWAWQDAQGKPGHETLLTLNFAEHAGKTKLTLHQAVFETVTARNAHQQGWTSGLDDLADYLAKAKEERV
ncbi:MAG TPA: SRPBCC domain-containing protein [Myxococcota bacterium]|nr:SRPBCC domain-containing protein [Myxococcota bacterium]